MPARINFKEIYKTSFFVFERVKLLRVFGAALTTSYLINCLVFYVVIMLILLVNYPSEISLAMLFENVSPSVKLVYFVSLGLVGVVSFLFYIIIKNWAYGSLTGGIYAYTHHREVSLKIASGYGKSFLKRLIMIDVVIGITFILSVFVLRFINSTLQGIFPQVASELDILKLTLSVIIFLFLFIIQSFAIRYAILDNKTYLIAIRKSVNLFKNNILNTLLVLLLNTLVLALFLLISVFGFITLYSLSALVSRVWDFLGYLFYNMTAIALITYIVLLPLSIGIYIIFAFVVWNKFWESLVHKS